MNVSDEVKTQMLLDTAFVFFTAIALEKWGPDEMTTKMDFAAAYLATIPDEYKTWEHLQEVAKYSTDRYHLMLSIAGE